MANIKALRKRIVGVKNTKQLTRAMKMVAAAKLRRSQENVEGSRPYMQLLREMLVRVAQGETQLSPLKGEGRLCLVFSSDRGLCGSYNTNVIKNAILYHQEYPGTKFVLFGKKVTDTFRKRSLPIWGSYPDFFAKHSWERCIEIIVEILDRCQKENIGELHAIYTRFISAGVQRLSRRQLIPFSLEDVPAVKPGAAGTLSVPGAKAASGKTSNSMMLVEPNREQVLSALVEHYSRFSFYHVSLEVIASEMAARMVAMDNATRNAEEMIDDLTLVMNRARQANITKELLEIIGGAEALQG